MARVIFVQRDAIEWLGVMYLSACLRQHGHVSQVVVEAEEGDRFFASVAELHPDMVAFSCLTSDFAWALARIATIKRSTNAIVVFGGTHVTLNPELAMAERDIDVVCRGEGEGAIVDMANAIDAGRPLSGISNLWVKTSEGIERNEVRPLIGDLDSLPFPDRSLYARYRFARRWGNRPIHASRGCPYNCSYCHNTSKRGLYAGKGPAVRWRTVDRVLAEIANLRASCFVSLIHFIDDGFGLDQQWLLDFLPRLKAQGGMLPTLHANMRADRVTDELCAGLAGYGRRRFRLRVAVECGDEDYRQKILNKRIRNTDLLRAAGLFRKHRIPFSTYSMFALPGETLAQAEETVRLNVRLGPSQPISFMYQPYPGTKLADYAVSIGVISRELLESLGTAGNDAFFHSSSPLHQPDIRKVENIQRIFPLAVKLPFLLPLALRIARVERLAPVLRLLSRWWTQLSAARRRLIDKY